MLIIFLYENTPYSTWYTRHKKYSCTSMFTEVEMFKCTEEIIIIFVLLIYFFMIIIILTYVD